MSSDEESPPPPARVPVPVTDYREEIAEFAYPSQELEFERAKERVRLQVQQEFLNTKSIEQQQHRRRGRPAIPDPLADIRREVIPSIPKTVTGLDYCEELDKKKIPPPWRSSGSAASGLPTTYVQGYGHPEWRHEIYRERSNMRKNSVNKRYTK